MARTTIISPNPASRVWRGHCVRPLRSIRAPRAKCHPPRVSSAADTLFSAESNDAGLHSSCSGDERRGPSRDRQVCIRPRWISCLGRASGPGVAPPGSPVAGAGSPGWWFSRPCGGGGRGGGGARLGAGGTAIFLANVLIALLMGFEAASLRRWTLSRRKWRQLDIVVADNEESAERRFFDRWTAKQRALAQRPAVDRGAPPPTRDIPGQPFSRPAPLPQSEIIGLFPEPGGSR